MVTLHHRHRGLPGNCPPEVSTPRDPSIFALHRTRVLGKFIDGGSYSQNRKLIVTRIHVWREVGKIVSRSLPRAFDLSQDLFIRDALSPRAKNNITTPRRRSRRQLSGPPGKLLAGCRRGLRASSVFCLLFVFPKVCVCARCLRRSISRLRSCG